MSRRVIVTGCSRGIGRALVEQYAALGIVVGGCARSTDLISKQGEEPHFRCVDVTDSAALEQWATDLSAVGMIPDLVVANAGYLSEPRALWETSSDEFDAVIDVNVKGVANTARAFLPRMIKAGKGTFVALSSGWGRSTSAGVAPYCASKFAVEGLIGALSQDLPSGVSAVALSPGVVHTEMLERAFGAREASQAVEPNKWALEAAQFLLALEPSCNGQSLTFQR